MAANETITIHLNYKKVLREVFFHLNKKRSAISGDDQFDMYQIYEYMPESTVTTDIKPKCSSDCGDENKLIKMLLQLLHVDSGEMQQLIRSFFKKNGENVTTNSESTQSKEVQANGLPIIGNAFSLNAAMINNLSNIVLTTKPLGCEEREKECEKLGSEAAKLECETLESATTETDCSPSDLNDVDDGMEFETYEMLDVVDNGSDAESSNGSIVKETNKSVDGPTLAKNGSSRMPKINRVFQGVTDRILENITTNRKDKIKASKLSHGKPTKKVAKKSTSDISKIKCHLISTPIVTKRIHATTYSRPKVPSQSVSRPKPFQPAEMNDSDETLSTPSDSEEGLIEVIEIPEKMQMEIDTLLNAVNEVSQEFNDDSTLADGNGVPEMEPKDYRCNICVVNNKNFAELKEHLFSVHVLPYVCRDCHQTFNLRISYDNHVRRGDCKEKLNTFRKFVTLIDPPIRESDIRANVSRNDEALFCGNCSRKFVDISQYSAHAQCHAKLFACKLCPADLYKTEEDMADHLLNGIHYAHRDGYLPHMYHQHLLYVQLKKRSKPRQTRLWNKNKNQK